MQSLKTLLAFTLLAIGILMPQEAVGMQASTASNSASAQKSKASATPTAQEIADAKGKGLVWVNLNTHVYHKDGSFYGTTKHGKFMTEDEATKAGNRAAKEPGPKKKAAASK